MSNRKINHRIPAIAIGVCFSFAVQFSAAQTVKTFVDKSTILIGEQLQYKVQATFLNGIYKVHWFDMPDSVAHFEVVEKSKIDTTATGNNTVLEQTITLTSFDSGRWHTPALMVNFDPIKDDTTVNIFTDSIPVNVTYAPADSTNELRDIKPIMEVKVDNYLWYYIVGGALLLLVLILFLWRYFKNKKLLPDGPVSKVSPYDEAMQSLEKLAQTNLQDAAAIKPYHIQLAEIFKWYISRKQRTGIMNKTTGDILIYLSNNNLPKENITAIATALRLGDAVKFAKFLPPAFESEQSLAVVKETIRFIHTSKPINPVQTDVRPGGQ